MSLPRDHESLPHDHPLRSDRSQPARAADPAPGAGGASSSRSAEALLAVVYGELRRLAEARLAHEAPGNTLQATALVHEAYLRLLDCDGRPVPWDHEGHFFAAAAEAMRRILIERARARGARKRGGDFCRLTLDAVTLEGGQPPAELLDLDEALQRLEQLDPRKAGLVKLRFYAGLSLPQAAAALGTSVATAERDWSFARAWLFAELGGGAAS
ncbi:MAG: sigma-70 family RNA polymerase sigma factor [Planctomycetia bacterium]|nr:MAG: sigma-70 family RNA polymerase sigma factor [Planctomycetia bacterium]